ncbi:MAG: hypothetical protein ACYC54_10410 [Sedimentisphaerales bacterium]
MLKIKGFNLSSVVIGEKHTRAFSVDNNGGIVADYVLGASCEVDSPFTNGFYGKVAVGSDGVDMFSDDDTRRLLVTRDRLMVSERTTNINENLQNDAKIFEQAKYIMPPILSFINKPKSAFLGIVWQFTESSVRARDTYNHPAAEELKTKLFKIELDPKEHPSEVNMRIAFRRKLQESWVKAGKNDYSNTSLNVFDIDKKDLWPEKNEKKDDSEIQPRLVAMSIDVQRILNPKLLLSKEIFDEHWNYCFKTIKPRMQIILEQMGFEIQKEQ